MINRAIEQMKRGLASEAGRQAVNAETIMQRQITKLTTRIEAIVIENAELRKRLDTQVVGSAQHEPVSVGDLIQSGRYGSLD